MEDAGLARRERRDRERGDRAVRPHRPAGVDSRFSALADGADGVERLARSGQSPAIRRLGVAHGEPVRAVDRRHGDVLAHRRRRRVRRVHVPRGGAVTPWPAGAVAVSVAFLFPAVWPSLGVSCGLGALAGSSPLLPPSAGEEASIPPTVPAPTPGATAAPRVTAAPAPSRKVTD